MSAWSVWIFRLLVLAALIAFGVQIANRLRLVFRAKNNLRLDGWSVRLRRLLFEVIFQSKTIAAKPVVGTGSCVRLLGLRGVRRVTRPWNSSRAWVSPTGPRPAGFTRTSACWFRLPCAVLAGMIVLSVRRAWLRPDVLSLSGRVSRESLLIGVFIAALMVTFLLSLRLEGAAAGVNWWVHALVILGFLVLIPNSKHLHLLISPVTLLLKSDRLGTVRNLDFEKEEVGFETVKDLEAKEVIDAFTCVECGRCQERCPAFATGKLLNPKKLILQNEEALLAGRFDQKLVDLYDPEVLWQCTTCGACEDACPVGIEHLPLVIGARRGLTSNGEAPAYMGAVYNHLERRGNIWGLDSTQRQKFMTAAGLEVFDPSKHEYLVWLGCAGNFEADYQKSLRSLFAILRAKGVTFGVLSKERCNGDPAKRTGNEFVFQELATQNIADLNTAGAKKVVTSCPHCLKTLGHDYQMFGFEATVVHSSVLVETLTRDQRSAARPRRSPSTIRVTSGAIPGKRRLRVPCWNDLAPASPSPRATAGRRSAVVLAGDCCSRTGRSKASGSARSGSISWWPPARKPLSWVARSVRSCCVGLRPALDGHRSGRPHDVCRWQTEER